MTQVVFSGSSGTIPNLNQNFTQLYALRELISDASYTAATPKLSVNAAGNWVIPAPSSGAALAVTGVTGAATVNFGASSAWQAAARAFEGTFTALGQDSNGAAFLSFNAYQSGASTWTYKSTDEASLLTLEIDGSYTVKTAPSGTAGNPITWTTRFTIGNTGTVVIPAPGSGTHSVSGGLLEIGTGGVGYATGAGGTVAQATSKSTGVTLNKGTGTITMQASALAAATSVSFVLTNSLIAATDVVNVSIKSGATLASYFLQVDATAAGSCTITLRNYTAGSLSEAVVLSFAVLKGVAA